MATLDKETIGQRVRRLRRERGMRARDLAKKVNSNQTSILHMENGVRATNMFTFIEVARVLNVSLDYLAYGKID
jgi:transcriptional regulator with XRE-family HTH domain